MRRVRIELPPEAVDLALLCREIGRRRGEPCIAVQHRTTLFLSKPMKSPLEMITPTTNVMLRRALIYPANSIKALARIEE